MCLGAGFLVLIGGIAFFSLSLSPKPSLLVGLKSSEWEESVEPTVHG